MKNSYNDTHCEGGADPQTPGADIPVSKIWPNEPEPQPELSDTRTANHGRRVPRDRSQAQRQAARLNGAKSGGPITPQGKHNSAANSRRHGVLSRCIVLPSENRQDFLSFLASLQPEFRS